EEPEEGALDAEEDEEHGERQGRPVPDPVAEEPAADEPGEDRAARERERPADDAEEVERPLPVAREEEDGERVEEARGVAAHAVARAAGAPRRVRHVDLGDREAARAREDGDEAVELAVERQLPDGVAREPLQ